MGPLELIAHRGYARRYPENTLAAVEAALAAGGRRVEIDVQLSRDRVPYLLHDRSLERMTGVPRSIAQLEASELDRLRASEKERFGERFASEPLARLSAFVATIARSPGVHAYVEIKRAALEVFGVDGVLDAVLPELAPIEGRCTLISFDLAVLLRARERSELPLGPVLITWNLRDAEEVLRMRPEVVFCDLEKLPATGELCVPHGELAVYEVDDPKIARDLHARGVRFVETFAIDEMLRGLA